MKMGQWGEGEGRALSGHTGAVTDCWTEAGGMSTNPCQTAGTAMAEVMGVGMHSPWKTKLSHGPGLKDNFGAEGETQPSPSV